MELFGRSQRAKGCAGGVSLGALGNDIGEDDCGENDDGSNRVVVGFSEEEVAAFKQRIARALDTIELAGKRPSKVSNDELMRLLRLFNERGVRFQ